MDQLTGEFDRVSIKNRGEGNGEDDKLKDQDDFVSMPLVERNKDFRCMERVDGRLVNIAEGLELHTGVFDAVEQRKIVNFVYQLQAKGRTGMLGERTYSGPRKWMRGKGRVTLQFGCCYNYAIDKDGNPPGIVRGVEADPIPPLLISMIKRMVAWRVLPQTCVPNSCIINIYDKDDCIPPHIDHHDFVRPFCTVSFLSECNILFGTNLKVLRPGEFSGPLAIPLPLGSVLIMNGNGADIAKHCVPAVPAKRISITFRKMDDGKIPYQYTPDPELQNLRSVTSPSARPPSSQPAHSSPKAVNPDSQNLIPDVGLTTTPVSQTRKVGIQARKPETANQGVKDSTRSNVFRANDFPTLTSASSKPSKRSWK